MRRMLLFGLEQIERNKIKRRVISIPAVAEENDQLEREPGEFLWNDPSGYDYTAFLRARQHETRGKIDREYCLKCWGIRRNP